MGEPPYVELHCRSAFSFLRGASGVEALAARAAALGMPALALTDYMTLAGVARFQAACVQRGIRPLVGVELAVVEPRFGGDSAPAVLPVLAQNATGYARLCRLLTDANLTNPEAPLVPFAALAAEPEGLILLTGGRDGTLARLLLAGRRDQAEAAARRYVDAFGPERVYVELQHSRLPDSVWLMQRLVDVAAVAGIRCVATNGVRHAARDDYALCDLLTCVRLGIPVDMPHAERPRNDEAYLKGESELAALFAPLPWGWAALAASDEIAVRCELSLLKGVCTAPRVALPSGVTPARHLRTLSEGGLATRYADAPEARAVASVQRRQMEHELEVIGRLELEEFFLCVADIMRQARAMGIRVSGRGSAANSLVAYLLGITGVDPIRHGLLFERFLNPDRRGMPDIDIDVQSDRREELIRYVERTYTHAHAAMVANVITYRPRLALRDAAKALGYPLPMVNRLTKVLPHHCDPDALPGYRDELAGVVRACLPGDGAPEADERDRCLARLPLLLTMAGGLLGLPRHLSLHNGGMVLTREPLATLLPVRVSANGVRALEVDKDDVERLGLIKFDILGLRTLGAVEEALALIEETTGTRPNVDNLPTDPPDPATMDLIRAGQTLAVFQIESPGQWHLLAQTQPLYFDDLIVQTALFRPGPLQANMVHPYVTRRQEQQHSLAATNGRPTTTTAASPEEPSGSVPMRRHFNTATGTTEVGQRDAVQTPWRDGDTAARALWSAHPVLGPILRESEGILLFQEQILEIAHRFAGLSYADADGFRRAMSHVRSTREMEAMHERFVTGALARGETAEDATHVFEAISKFVGYGFCKSHAAEFARTIYATAWLKAHYPAHYLAAFMTAQPAGFFPIHVVAEEAKLLGVPVLPPDVNRSLDRFSVERVGSEGHRRWAIRIGLRQVARVGEELARAILWERTPGSLDAPEQRPYTTLADLCRRLRPAGLTWDAAEALVLCGACDGLRPRMERRQRLWQLHELWPLVSPAGAPRSGGASRRGRAPEKREYADRPAQLAFDWPVGVDCARSEALPPLPALDRSERAALDYTLLGLSAQPHPMALRRRALRRRGVYTIAELGEAEEGRILRVAGWPISAQRPPTAKGMGFLVLEDETGRLPVALPPRLAADLHRVIRDARVVIVTGRVERVRWYRSLLATGLDATA